MLDPGISFVWPFVSGSSNNRSVACLYQTGAAAKLNCASEQMEMAMEDARSLLVRCALNDACLGGLHDCEVIV